MLWDKEKQTWHDKFADPSSCPSRPIRLVRGIGRYVSAIPLLLGYFWMLWDKEKQTWHDKFADSVVVPEVGLSGREVAVGR